MQRVGGKAVEVTNHDQWHAFYVSFSLVKGNIDKEQNPVFAMTITLKSKKVISQEHCSHSTNKGPDRVLTKYCYVFVLT